MLLFISFLSSVYFSKFGRFATTKKSFRSLAILLNEITPDLIRIYSTISDSVRWASFSAVRFSSLSSSYFLRINEDVEKSFSLLNGASLSAYDDPLS